MELIDIKHFTDKELEELLISVGNERQRRANEKIAEAEKAFYEAGCALYKINPWHTFPIYASDLEEKGGLTLELLLQEM